MHEQVYQDLKKQGFISWDRNIGPENFFDHQIPTYLQKFCTNFSKMKVLDLGTGTGISALFCSREGAEAIGVDISKTAVEMARANNDFFKLKARFIEADILELNLGETFDLVIDSSLLHCLVGTEDRTKFYQMVKRHLGRDGKFFVHTMTAGPSMSSLTENQFFHLDSEILYSKGIKDITEGRREFNGQSYFPHRTILRLENLTKEFECAGFKIEKQEIVTQENGPDNFIGLLCKP